MTEIIKGNTAHCKLLTQIGIETFMEPHGKSASKADVDAYINNTFNEKVFYTELSNPENIYHLIYHENKIAGYSKIILNTPNINITDQNVTKLERLYLLKAYYGKNLAQELFNFNIQLSKKNNQKGVWLTVWIENHRAINFYKKIGFKIVGNSDFVVSDTHTNPQHVMYLEY